MISTSRQVLSSLILLAVACNSALVPHEVGDINTASGAFRSLISSIDNFQFSKISTRSDGQLINNLQNPTSIYSQEGMAGFIYQYQNNLMKSWTAKTYEGTEHINEAAKVQSQSNFLANLLAQRSQVPRPATDIDHSGLGYSPDAYEVKLVVNNLDQLIKHNQIPHDGLEFWKSFSHNLPKSTSFELVYNLERKLSSLSEFQRAKILKILSGMGVVHFEQPLRPLQWPVWLGSNTEYFHWLQFCKDYRMSEEGRQLLNQGFQMMSSNNAFISQAYKLAKDIENSVDPSFRPLKQTLRSSL